MPWYQPKSFAVDDRAQQLAVMRAHPFATLLSASGAEVGVTHLPLVVEEAGDGLRLLGHVARANPHWSGWGDAQPVVAIFHGPSAYVAPSWYPSTKTAVPTWNYIAVHAHGRVRIAHDSDAKERLLKALVDEHDPAYRADWDALEPDFREQLKRAIVGVTIEVDRVEAKFKLSQNRPAADQAGVRQAHAAGGAEARELADWMQRLGIGAA